VLVLGLTGGIGSGKSSVSERLATRGAVIVDADAITRAVQEPGGEAFAGIVERFGEGILAPDGRIDRPALAAIVFADATALHDLEQLTHPVVGARIAAALDAAKDTDDVVVLDIPLLVEKGHRGARATIVVDCPPEVAVRRLVAHRGFTEDDARARMANQVSREERLALADFVVDNGGDLAHLDAEVDRLWTWIEGLRAEARNPSSGPS
jgi:dephospho-CoA kinase